MSKKKKKRKKGRTYLVTNSLFYHILFLLRHYERNLRCRCIPLTTGTYFHHFNFAFSLLTVSWIWWQPGIREGIGQNATISNSESCCDLLYQLQDIERRAALAEFKSSVIQYTVLAWILCLHLCCVGVLSVQTWLSTGGCWSSPD